MRRLGTCTERADMRTVKLFVLVVCLMIVPARAQRLSDQPEVASRIVLLDEWIKTQMEYSGLPGLVIGIVQNQETVWSKAYGYADVDTVQPMRTGTIFRIASHSKLFTSIAIMQLRDAGKIRLDDPIALHLPWLDIKNRYPDAPPITIRHLLTHSAGLPRESNHPSWTEYSFPTADEVMETISTQATIYPSETKWKYSNLGLTLAGMIVEASANQPYKAYIEDKILAPLGMTSTSVGVPTDAHRGRMATGYGRRMPDGTRAVMPFIDAKAFDPATGLSSTVDDMIKFLSWQMRIRDGYDNEVLHANTLREMQRVHWLQDDWIRGSGLGFAIAHTEDRDLVGHGGSYPGYRTNTQLSPKEKIGVVVFTSGGDGNPRQYIERAFRWVAPPLVRAVESTTVSTVQDKSWLKYIGTYRSRGGDSKILVLDGQLSVISPLNDDPLETKIVLVPAGEHTFTMVDEGGGPHGELARFELNEQGEVTRFYRGVNYAERIR